MITRREFLGVTGVAIGVAAVAAVAAPAPSLPEQFIARVRSRLGCEYLLGAEGPTKFDCSGLVQWAWRQVGIRVPRTANSQFKAATPIKVDEMRLGDSVFFLNQKGFAHHTLVYAGDGTYYQASAKYSDFDGVVLTPLPEYKGRIRYGRLVG